MEWNLRTVDDVLLDLELTDYSDFLIDGVVSSTVTTILGDPYLGKTYLAIDIARSLTTGAPFLGRPVIRQVDRVAFLCTDPGGNITVARRVNNPAGVLDNAPSYQGVAGYIFNLPVYLDGNMPANLGGGSNETRVIVADFEDLMLFEDNAGAPSQMRFEQPSGNSLGIMLVAYGYSAFAAGRQPKAISVLSGTGLITPSL